jgi:hypothetical protein
MDYAYQQSFGNIWNDFDDMHWRDHVFAYPISNGVIDTIQWEGWREGEDDTRYIGTLIKKEGNDTAARTIISSSLAKGEDMETIRKKIIEQIQISQSENYPTITVMSPNGGETWQRGTNQTITWRFTGSPGSTVKIVLLKAGTEVGTIKDSTSIGSSGTGSYTWPMASTGTTGTDFKVNVQSISLPTIKDTSNNSFTITSTT